MLQGEILGDLFLCLLMDSLILRETKSKARRKGGTENW